MGLFDKFKSGLQKTHSKLVHEIKRVITRSPKLEGATLEELEAALIAADLGLAMTSQIVAAVKKSYETQGGTGLDVFSIASGEVEKSLASNKSDLIVAPGGLTVVSSSASTAPAKPPPPPSSRTSFNPKTKPRCSPPAIPFAPPPLSKSNSGASA